MRSSPHAPQVWVGLLRRFLKLSGQPEAIARGLGFDDARYDPDSMVPAEWLHQVVEAVEPRGQAVRVALKLAAGLDPHGFDALGYLVLSSPDYGTALNRVNEYRAAWMQGDDYAVAVAGGRVRVQYRPLGAARPAHAIWAALAALDIGAGAPVLLGRSLPELRVELRGPAPEPATIDILAAALGCRPVWEAEVDVVAFGDAALTWPIVTADPQLHAMMCRWAHARLPEDVGQGWSERVRGALSGELHRGRGYSELAAKALAIPVRSLARKLQEERTGVRNIVDELRRQRSCELLAAGAEIAEVSYLLGFSEPRAFHRAFKRWHGVTPEAWRRDQAAG